MDTTNYTTTINDDQKNESSKREIRFFNGRSFYNLCGNNYFDEERVHSEFLPLMNIPFLYVLTITYTGKCQKTPHSEQGRNAVMHSIFKGLNEELSKVHPDLPTRSHIVDYVRINEFGTSDDEVHTHSLIHIHPHSLTKVAGTVFWFLRELSATQFSGVKEFHVQRIYDQAGTVSYLCKYEQGKDRDYKHFVFSPSFKSIAAKHHSSRFFLYHGMRVEMDSDQDPYKPYRVKNPPNIRSSEPLLTGMESFITEDGILSFDTVRLGHWQSSPPTPYHSSKQATVSHLLQNQVDHNQLTLSFLASYQPTPSLAGTR